MVQFLVVTIVSFVHFTNGIPESEFLALRDFYNATNGDNWIRKTNWKFDQENITSEYICNLTFPNSDEYTPHGIFCCENSSNICDISMIANNLDGTIPLSFANFSKLTLFRFEFNPKLTGPIPPTIFDSNYPIVNSLEYIQIVVCNITGTIPTTINNLKRLKFLEIIDTKMEGTIPNSLYKLNNTLEVLWFESISNLSFELTDDLCLFRKMQQLSFVNMPLVYGIINNNNCINNNLHNLTVLQFGTGGLLTRDETLGTFFNISGNLGIDFGNGLKSLTLISIGNTNVTGNFLSSNSEDSFEVLNTITLTNNSFYGTISPQICNYLGTDPNTNANLIINDNNFNGTIPSCLWKNYYLNSYISEVNHGLDLSNNQFSGSIEMNMNNMTNNSHNSDTICYFQQFALDSNMFSGTLPNWLTDCAYTTTGITLSSNKFEGSILSGWNAGLIYFGNNKFSGTVGDDFCVDNEAVMVSIGNNKLHGTLPLGLVNLGLEILDASNNEFDTIMLDKVNNENLLSLDISNNNIENINDIGSVLNSFFNNNEYVQGLLLSGNKHITGDIGKWTKFPHRYDKGNNLSLTLHDCDIFGSFSDKLSINDDNILFLTFYNNRLSCNLPKSMFNNESSLLFEYLLLGNLFTILKDNDLPKWMNSPFKHVVSLYLTMADEILSYTYISISGICFIVIIVFKTCKKSNFSRLIVFKVPVVDAKEHSSSVNNNRFWERKNSNNSDNNNNDNDNNDNNDALLSIWNENEIKRNKMFLQSIEDIFNVFSSKITITVCVVLTVIYVMFGNYYQCGRLTSHASLTYFVISREQTLNYSIYLKYIIEILIILLICVFNVVLFHNLRVFEKNAHNVGDARLRESGLMSSNDNNSGQLQTGCCWKIFRFVVYFGCYLFTIAFVIIYISSHYLPPDNIFNINHEWMQYLIQYSLIFILTISNIFIVPKLIDSFWKIITMIKSDCKQKQSIYMGLLMFLRSFQTIIVPFFASLLFLQDCGRYWTQFWSKCTDDPTSFNEYIVALANLIDVQYYDGSTIMSHESICKAAKIADINFNKCFRQFFGYWIEDVILPKLVLLILNPTFFYFIHKYNVKNRLKKYCCCCSCKWLKCTCCNVNKNDMVNDININSQYAMIGTSMELFIMFSIISPFAIFLILFALMITYCFYSKMLNQLRCKLVNFYNSQNFPITYLYTSLIVQQLLIVLFCANIFQIENVIVMICMFMLISVVSVAKLVWQRKGYGKIVNDTE